MGMELDVAQPLLLAPGEGETTTDRPGRTITILCDFEQLIVSLFRYEPGEKGPDPHIHRQHTDAFYVLEGEVDFGLGPEITRLKGGRETFAGAPPNVVHTFQNSSDATAIFLNVHAPSMGFGDVLRGGGHEHFDQFDPPADGGRPFEDAIVQPPGAGEPVEHENTSHRIQAELPELSVIEMTFRPDFEGVDSHTHEDHVDVFYVLSGEADFVVGNEVRRAGPGSFLAALPGARHGFSNPGPADLRVLNFHAPDAGFVGRLRS
ncbi:MAG: cupin domain-containing protein [Actinobacteria bacterium]|nr:MAG: cupin domain-containing protein [Actinomycetota bacterium]